MDTIENKIKTLLQTGQIIDDEEKEFLNVDFTLDQQNYELVSRGIDPKVSSEFKPKIGLNITYIVMAVIFNDRNEILMMQEAKSNCIGLWYLPAGKVEPGERFEDAVKREVFEETGLEFEPKTLLKMESSHGSWFRFVYTGRIVGGQLKKVAQADKESLQACYVSDISKLSLRSKDCLKLIELGREYRSRGPNEWHEPQLTIHRSVPNLFLRLLVAIRDKNSNTSHVLISDSLIPHLPMSEINPTRSLHSSLKRFIQSHTNTSIPQHKPCGLLAVEHDPATQADQHDGLCLTVLVLFRDSLQEIGPTKTGYTWRQLDSEMERLLLSKFSTKSKTLMHSVL